MSRRQLPLDRDSLVAGTMPVVLGALKQLEVPKPTPMDYPEVLTQYLHRRVWKTTLGAVRHQLFEDRGLPVFVKPADRAKSFTGCLLESPNDAYKLGMSSQRQQVWCSEVVRWVAEFRVYVARSEILGIDRYAGDSATDLDLTVIRQAVADFQGSGRAFAAYALDFGVLASGETALVELNDGFSLGLYDLPPAKYTELILARWAELIRSAERP